eukprot:714409-Prymnesium_polylepis.1
MRSQAVSFRQNQEGGGVSTSRWPSARMPYMKYSDANSSRSKREFWGTRWLGERESLSTVS